eukprot:scaffold23957_cov56-Attheya_sp.AAC.1
MVLDKLANVLRVLVKECFKFLIGIAVAGWKSRHVTGFEFFIKVHEGTQTVDPMGGISGVEDKCGMQRVRLHVSLHCRAVPDPSGHRLRNFQYDAVAAVHDQYYL